MSILSSFNSDNEYLDHILDPIDSAIKLDNEQKSVVLSDDKCILVIAGAGTGKTTTVAAKVRYLVEKEHVTPEKILVMSYTKKATEELERRIKVDLGINAEIRTFHSLGLAYYRLLNPNKKIIPIDNNYQNKIFLSYLKEVIFPSKEKLQEMIEIFNDNEIHWPAEGYTYGNYFKEHFNEYNSFDEYFASYVDKKIKESLNTQSMQEKIDHIVDQMVNGEVSRTIKNEIVKSKGEAVIANFLYCNGVDYEYERIYSELMDENRVYRPDFTVDVGGEKIYIEFFGKSGNKLDNKSYERIREKKELYHRSHGNRFISLDYKPHRGYLKDLEKELIKYGVELKLRDPETIYRQILGQNPLAEFFNLKKFIFETIEIIKSSETVRSGGDVAKMCANRINLAPAQRREIMKKQYNFINDFWKYYKEKNSDTDIEHVDFSDMITGVLGRLNEINDYSMKYDYVIVDEYQDISVKRYELLKETIDRSNARFMAVGDDWQSIFSFMGGKVKYIHDFNHFFPGAKTFFISKTYRNARSLVKAAGTFIMRNGYQIEKDLKSDKDYKNPIQIVGCTVIDENGEEKYNRNTVLKRFIVGIHEAYPDDSILVLGHTNNAIRNLLKSCPDLIDSAENKVKIRGIDDFYFDLMTIHKSKGLTYDWVIVLPLPEGFPHDPFDVFWMRDLFRNEPETEKIEYPEFRRLFYVALTRTKKKVILLSGKKDKRSRYIGEIEGILKYSQE